MRNYTAPALMLLATTAAAIGSYTVNLQVSAERAQVVRLQRQLAADARDIRSLEAELRTRARLPEMQRWNDNVLLMAAPAATQYLRSPVQLAAFVAPPAPAVPAPAVQLAVTGPEVAAPALPSAPVAADYALPAAAPAPAALVRASFGVVRPPPSAADKPRGAAAAPRLARAAYLVPAGSALAPARGAVTAAPANPAAPALAAPAPLRATLPPAQ